MAQIKELVSDYIESLEQQGVMVERAILYGSYAKGTASPNSDIDLVIISADLERWAPIERLQMLSRATWAVRAPLEVLGYTPDEIVRHGDESIFWEEINSYGKEIYRHAA